MTPAIQQAKRAKIPFQVHTYEHDPDHPSYGEEAAEKLNLDPASVFKTLVVSQPNGALAVAVVPVLQKLDLKAMAKALGCKKISMANPADAERSTGYVLGGVSPLGQKKPLPTVLDDSAQPLERMFVSGGRRGVDIELAPSDLARLLKAKFAPIGL